MSSARRLAAVQWKRVARRRGEQWRRRHVEGLMEVSCTRGLSLPIFPHVDIDLSALFIRNFDHMAEL